MRYETVDTDDDGQKDAIDPDQRDGDEVFRALEVFAKLPEQVENSDLNGTFGRVYLGASLDSSGHIEAEVERNELTFDGNGTVDSSATTLYSLARNGSGSSSVSSSAVSGATDLPVVLGDNGDIASIGGENIDGYINDTFDLLTFTEAEGTDSDNAFLNTTLAVKLPDTAPEIADRQYRLLFLDVYFEDQFIEIGHSRFDSVFTWDSNTAGSLTVNSATVSTGSLQAEVESERDPTQTYDTTATIADNGATTVTVNDGEGRFELRGYLNETGSLGVFNTFYTDSNADGHNTIGLAVMVEVSE